MVPSGALFVHGLYVFVLHFFGKDISNQGPVFRCFVRDKGVCVFERFYIGVENPRFVPFAIGGSNRNVTKVEFNQKSHLSILTRNLCDIFPSLEELNGNDLGLSDIQPDAFQGCPSLRVLSLQGNNLTKIDPHLFRSTPHLTSIDLRHNRLLTLDLQDIIRQVPALDVIYIDKVQWQRIPFKSRIMSLSEKVTIDMRDNQR